MAVTFVSVDERVVCAVTDNMIERLIFEQFVDDFGTTHGSPATQVASGPTLAVVGIENPGEYDSDLWCQTHDGLNLVPNTSSANGRSLASHLESAVYRPATIEGMPEGIPLGIYADLMVPTWACDNSTDAASVSASWDCPVTLELVAGHQPTNRLKQKLDLSIWTPAI